MSHTIDNSNNSVNIHDVFAISHRLNKIFSKRLNFVGAEKIKYPVIAMVGNAKNKEII